MTTRAALDPIVGREGMQALSQMYLGDRDRKHPLAAPTHAKLEGLPPILIQMGTRETQHDDGVSFVEKLLAAHVAAELEVWDGMLHVFQMFPVLPDAKKSIDRAGEFLRSKMG
jgi:acetyl esterase/lipase